MRSHKTVWWSDDKSRAILVRFDVDYDQLALQAYEWCEDAEELLLLEDRRCREVSPDNLLAEIPLFRTEAWGRIDEGSPVYQRISDRESASEVFDMLISYSRDGETSIEQPAQAMSEPQIVTEIRRDGIELGLPTSQIDQDLVECASAEDVQSLRRVYFARLASRDWHISLDLDDGWTVSKPMTEEEFEQWVESRPSPEQFTFATQTINEVAQEIADSPEQKLPHMPDDFITLSTIRQIVAKEIADSSEQTPVPLPYALKVEMLVNNMQCLLARQDALEHRIGSERESDKVDKPDKQESPASSSLLLSVATILTDHINSYHPLEALHDNLDADLTDLSNRVKELEAKHQYE